MNEAHPIPCLCLCQRDNSPNCGLMDGEYEERSIEVRTAKRIAAGIRSRANGAAP